MFGSKGNSMEQMVQKKQWDKINKKLQDATVQTKLELAQACGNATDDYACNFLINLLKDSDENVQLHAVKALGLKGTEIAVTHLRWLFDNTPDEKENLKNEIRGAISIIKNRKK